MGIYLYSEASSFHIAGEARRELGAGKILVVCRAVRLFRRGGLEENMIGQRDSPKNWAVTGFTEKLGGNGIHRKTGR